MSAYPHPAFKAPIVCEKCLNLHPLENFLVETPIEELEGNVVEGALVCPTCNFKRHTYYLDQETINFRLDIKIRIDELAAVKPPSHRTVEELKNLWREYRGVFDACQWKYRQLLEKSVIENGTGK